MIFQEKESEEGGSGGGRKEGREGWRKRKEGGKDGKKANIIRKSLIWRF